MTGKRGKLFIAVLGLMTGVWLLFSLPALAQVEFAFPAGMASMRTICRQCRNSSTPMVGCITNGRAMPDSTAMGSTAPGFP